VTIRPAFGVASVLLALTPAPATEIYLAPFTEGPPKTTRIGFIGIQRNGVKVDKPVNITLHPGLDDQPCFVADSTGLLFASTRDGQTGNYRYDLATKTVARAEARDPACAPASTPDGRPLVARPKTGTMTFVDKRVDGIAMIREVTISTNRTTTLATALEGSENLAWTPGGIGLMAARSKIFMLEIDDDRWIEIADLKGQGIRAITQLAISPDSKWIAIVSDPAVK
jgi:Tol biopolymer transport system component